MNTGNPGIPQTYEAPRLNTEFLTESAKQASDFIGNLARRRDVHLGDRLFLWVVRSLGVLTLLGIIAIAIFLFQAAYPALKATGFMGFLMSHQWDPVRDIYGAMPVVYGTLVSSFVSLVIAAPLSVGIALFVNELAPARIGQWIGILVEMLAAIPSVVYGLWGIFVLAPFFRTVVQPFLIEHLGFIPLFEGPAYGVGMFTAGVILSIMIIPTISAISREVFRAIPRSQREGALALGATRWEMMKLAVLQSSRTGLFGAVILGLGRALGETMAVTMVIGNRAEIMASIFAPGQTMASVIANEYAEATSDVHLSALAAVGLVLFGVTFIVNAVARILVWRVTRTEVLK